MQLSLEFEEFEYGFLDVYAYISNNIFAIQFHIQQRYESICDFMIHVPINVFNKEGIGKPMLDSVENLGQWKKYIALKILKYEEQIICYLYSVIHKYKFLYGF